MYLRLTQLDDRGAEVTVFSSHSPVRRQMIRCLAVAAMMAGLFLSASFVVEVMSVRPLEPLPARNPLQLSQSPSIATPVPGGYTRFTYDTQANSSCATVASASARPLMAYLPANDDAASAALAAHCGALDTVLVESFTLLDLAGTVSLRSDGDIAIGTSRVLPTLNFARTITAAQAETFLADGAKVAGLATRIGLLAEGGATGLCLDLSGRAKVAADIVRSALATLIPTGTRCLIGSIDATFWADSALVQSLDLAIAQGFRPASGPADPPAPVAWFSQSVERITALIPADKRVIALGTLGHSWQSGNAAVDTVGFSNVMVAASRYDVPLVFVPWTNALRSRYVDGDGLLTEIWLPDAASLQNQLLVLGPTQKVAIWPLGSEDPTIWPLLTDTKPPERMLEQPLKLDRLVTVVGEGPIVVSATPALVGRREVEIDTGSGRVVSVSYMTLPKPAQIERGGGGGALEVQLIFSSLPPLADWPALRNTLTSAGVGAAFLVSPRELIDRGAVARQAVQDGYAIGLKTDDSVKRSPLLTRWADNSQQLLMIERTGVRGRLVEPGGAGGWSGIALQSQRLIAAGYVPVLPSGEGSAEVISSGGGRGPIVLSRDGLGQRVDVYARPGDWAQVLAELPGVLGEMVQSGHLFSSVYLAAGMTAEEAMPQSAPQIHIPSRVVFSVIDFLLNDLNAIFFWFLIYSVVRSLLYLVMSLIRRPKYDYDPTWTPQVSVLIPAFNEALVIGACIRSILSSSYPNLHVVVVDDGSTDGTYEVAREAFGDDPRGQIIRQPNGGKWRAANAGLEIVQSPFFLIADADSMFGQGTIGWLMQQFQDDRVGAVAGLVEVGNRETLLGSFQAVEYLVSQSIMRRAQEAYGGILVVPGAIGAWRTEAVRKAGMFSGATMTEDADLTVAVHRAGYRVAFQEQARSVTEAPSTIHGFMRQRLRWTFGMLQTSWKHRASIIEGRPVGYLSIIDAVWFGVVTSLLSPLVDWMMLVLLAQGVFAVMTGGAAGLFSVPTSIVIAYLLLTAIDVLNVLVSFAFERRFDWRLLVLVLLQRFGYRQLIYISTIRAIGQALSGTASGWNKLDRTGVKLLLWSQYKGAVEELPTARIMVGRLPAP